MNVAGHSLGVVSLQAQFLDATAKGPNRSLIIVPHPDPLHPKDGKMTIRQLAKETRSG